MKKVLVTDASQRKAVPIIRSLGSEKIPVVAGEDRWMSMGFFSRYAGQSVVYPPPEDETRFVGWLIEHARKGLFDIVFPIDERTMHPITKHLHELEQHMILPVVDHDTFMMARNKANTMKIAYELGIPVPQTISMDASSNTDEILESAPLPAVIKPTQSSGSRGLSYVFDRGGLREEYGKVHSRYPYPLIQEYIPPGGRTFGVEFLCDRGSIERVFVHRRIREFPIHGGPSTLRESVNKPDIVEHAIRLMEKVKWHGVAMVEFKEDPRSGRCLLMEVNPKFWGSIALPIAAGVDFPYLLYRLACEEVLGPDPGYKEHVLCRWLFPGDILHFIFNPDRFHLEPSFFRFRGMSYDLLDMKDPGPIILLLVSAMKDIFSPKIWKEKITRGA